MKPNYFIQGNNTVQVPEDLDPSNEVVAFTISDSSKEFTVTYDKTRAMKLFETIRHSFAAFEKEPIYIRAIRNLVKTKNFLNLNLQLTNNEITEEEYDAEIDANKKCYAVVQNKNPDASEVKVVMEVAKSIDMDLSTSEVSQIFGIEHKCVIDYHHKRLEK